MHLDTHTERRQPRIGVDDLRRDLRDADRDRFQLRSQLEDQLRGRTTSSRILGALILIAGGLTSTLWLTLPGGAPSPQRNTVALPREQPGPALVDRRPQPAEPTVVTLDGRATVSAGATKTSTPEPAAARPAPRRPRTTISRPRASSGAVGVAPTPSGRNEPQRPPRRPRPRPLSPGEFGRQARL